MTFTTKPKILYDYTAFQTGSPTDPLPAMQVASDFGSHKASIDAVIEFQKLVQRSDGRLNSGGVRPETLSAGTVALIGHWTPRGGWLTATAYAVNDLIEQPAGTGNNYVCLIAHTSGTFATDLAAGKWMLLDGAAVGLGADQTFTGTNTFSGAVNVNGAAAFNGAVDMTGGTPTVPTAAVGHAWAFVRYSRDYIEEEREAAAVRAGIHGHSCEPVWRGAPEQRKLLAVLVEASACGLAPSINLAAGQFTALTRYRPRRWFRCSGCSTSSSR